MIRTIDIPGRYLHLLYRVISGLSQFHHTIELSKCYIISVICYSLPSILRILLRMHPIISHFPPFCHCVIHEMLFLKCNFGYCIRCLVIIDSLALRSASSCYQPLEATILVCYSLSQIASPGLAGPVYFPPASLFRKSLLLFQPGTPVA